MFEGAITTPVAGSEGGAGLRRVDWHELVARLSAARELRAALALPVGRASFAPNSAAGLTLGLDGERGVNRDALACSKRHEAIRAGGAAHAAAGDRELQ
jgi:hypothetical protein